MNTRVCKKCGREFPETEEYFVKSKECKCGISFMCKICKALYCKQYQEENKEHLIKYLKQYEEKNKTHLNNFRKQYREDNKEHIAEFKKQYREDNKQFIAEKSKQYYTENKKHIEEGKKIYREKNREYFTEYFKQYKRNNKEYFRLKDQKRRALKCSLPYTLTLEQWKKCVEYFNHSCAYCGKEEKLSQDHLIALSKGGGYEAGNIIPACPYCNSSKGTKEAWDWFSKQLFYDKEREENILNYLDMVMNENNNQNDESAS